MQGKIALEEHFATAETLLDAGAYLPAEIWAELKKRLFDIHDFRLRQMDENGIELCILSLNAPSVQAVPDPVEAEDLARRANDALAEQVAKRPDRFQGFAALPMQDPDRAIRELERCVTQLKFKGALVNGFSQIGDGFETVYYDLPQYRPFWRRVEDLGVPFYLHPRNPMPADARVYDGHPWLMGPAWAFGQETAVHALRLMGCGLFDECPALTVILGHMGEGLPYNLWRVDNHNAWMRGAPAYTAKEKIAVYFQRNFYLTTAGNCHTPTLVAAMMEMGADRILFSTDWPYETIADAAAWFDAAAISDNDKFKIGRLNAQRLFGLSA